MGSSFKREKAVTHSFVEVLFSASLEQGTKPRTSTGAVSVASHVSAMILRVCCMIPQVLLGPFSPVICKQ